MTSISRLDEMEVGWDYSVIDCTYLWYSVSYAMSYLFLSHFSRSNSV